MRTQPSAFGVLIGLTTLGGMITINTLPAVWRGIRSRRWRRTSGRITWDGMTLGSASSDEIGGLAPLVVYYFEVDGTGYEGDRIAFARSVPVLNRFTTPLFGATPDVRSGLRSGTAVDVWYDPNDPRRSVLRPGVGPGHWSMLSLGLILLILGIATLTLSATPAP